MTREPVTGDEAAALVDGMRFARMVGVQAISAGPDEVRGRLDWRAETCTTGGVMHGGALMTLADSLGAVCAVLNLPAGAWTGTIESKTNFFRAVRAEFAEAVSRPLHVGRTTIVVQTDLFDTHNRRVAQVTQTQAVLSASV
jgi:1,4-dihydroxy-2-naphthoyl-CoA hydrolase